MEASVIVRPAVIGISSARVSPVMNVTSSTSRLFVTGAQVIADIEVSPVASSLFAETVSASVAPAQVIEATVAQRGLQGPPGPGFASPGPGLKIVGAEFRLDIASLTRG